MNKFLKAEQNASLPCVPVSVIVTILVLAQIYHTQWLSLSSWGNLLSTHWFSLTAGLSFSIFGNLMMLMLFGPVLDNRSRNDSVLITEKREAFWTYLFAAMLITIFFLLRIPFPKFALGFPVGIIVGVVLPSMVVFITIGGVPWIVRKKAKLPDMVKNI